MPRKKFLKVSSNCDAFDFIKIAPRLCIKKTFVKAIAKSPLCDPSYRAGMIARWVEVPFA
jgi:hypothetical protein